MESCSLRISSFVLGTDKYPPFSLKPREDYPADLHIDYPERLSQWMPLVKWFLAIPHFFVLMAFVDGSVSYSRQREASEPFQNSPSIIEVQNIDMQDGSLYSIQNLLPSGFQGYFGEDDKVEKFSVAPGLLWVLIPIALIALLFTGRYPRSIFRLIMGINRWGYRVYAYVLLLTDRYPPFRLMD